MKPYFCRWKMSSLARALLVFDIFRAMLVSPVLIGVFFGMACVQIHRFNETVIPDGMYNVKRVDYYKNREMLVGCIVVGISICGADILMALALDKILMKHQGNAYMMWLTFSILTLFLRNGFYTFIWKQKVELGLYRLDDLTPTVKATMHVLFLAAIIYEGVKLLQLCIGMALPREFEEKNRIVPELKGEKNPKRMLRLF